ncbi:MAG TPA: hypothetical protein VIE43_14145 [Thermoanaerobaculia bacterium]|nr:hypothetical protein [Thermoanaerobaculia bacterium]
MKKQGAKRLTIQKETLSDLRAVTGGDGDHRQRTIEDTVYHGTGVSVGCTVGCPIQT